MIDFSQQTCYVVVGSREGAKDFVCAHCENYLGKSLVGYADFNEWSGGSFGIDEARELRTKQQRVGLNDKKFFLVLADSLTHEAQNALLKTLEEPTADTFIFIAVPSAQNLLPTLLSRVLIFNLEKKEGEITDLQKIASDFLQAKPAERLEMTEQIFVNHQPDRANARVFGA